MDLLRSPSRACPGQINCFAFLQDFETGQEGFSREEAEEIGLLSGKYRQFVPPEYIEQYLAGELP